MSTIYVCSSQGANVTKCRLFMYVVVKVPMLQNVDIFNKMPTPCFVVIKAEKNVSITEWPSCGNDGKVSKSDNLC
jgi:hypothetical protein